MFSFLSNAAIVAAATATFTLGALTGGTAPVFAGFAALIANVIRNRYL